MSLYAMGKVAQDRISGAIGYPKCPKCGEEAGNPCRTPRWRTTNVHKAREAAKRRQYVSNESQPKE